MARILLSSTTRRCSTSDGKSHIAMAAAKRRDDYRPPRNWRRQLWTEYALAGIIIGAIVYVVYFLFVHVLKIFG